MGSLGYNRSSVRSDYNVTRSCISTGVHVNYNLSVRTRFDPRFNVNQGDRHSIIATCKQPFAFNRHCRSKLSRCWRHFVDLACRKVFKHNLTGRNDGCTCARLNRNHVCDCNRGCRNNNNAGFTCTFNISFNTSKQHLLDVIRMCIKVCTRDGHFCSDLTAGRVDSSDHACVDVIPPTFQGHNRARVCNDHNVASTRRIRSSCSNLNRRV